jgi:protein required for attachment to host cells
MSKRIRKDKAKWVVTIDGARAHFYALEETPERLVLSPTGSFYGNRRLTQDIVTDRPGHTKDSTGRARHTMEPHISAHDFAEAEFVAHVADELAKDSAKGLFDELIVVADPKSLGSLRKDFDKHFQDKYIVLEIAHDWSKLSPSEVAEHLRPHLEKPDRVSV